MASMTLRLRIGAVVLLASAPPVPSRVAPRMAAQPRRISETRVLKHQHAVAIPMAMRTSAAAFPVTTAMIGVGSAAILLRLRAIASCLPSLLGAHTRVSARGVDEREHGLAELRASPIIRNALR